MRREFGALDSVGEGSRATAEEEEEEEEDEAEAEGETDKVVEDSGRGEG